MDLPLAANEIYLCSIANDYQRRVNSYPEAPLALLGREVGRHREREAQRLAEESLGG